VSAVYYIKFEQDISPLPTLLKFF